MTKTHTWEVFKLSENAKIPTRANFGDLGYDLYSCENILIKKQETIAVATGLRIFFPEGWGAIIHNRSSISLFKGLHVGGGVIDQGYRGEIKVILHNISNEDVLINVGDKIAQLIPKRVINVEFRERSENVIASTERGEAGFGSSDNL